MKGRSLIWLRSPFQGWLSFNNSGDSRSVIGTRLAAHADEARFSPVEWAVVGPGSDSSSIFVGRRRQLDSAIDAATKHASQAIINGFTRRLELDRFLNIHRLLPGRETENRKTGKCKTGK